MWLLLFRAVEEGKRRKNCCCFQSNEYGKERGDGCFMRMLDKCLCCSLVRSRMFTHAGHSKGGPDSWGP